MQNLKSAIRFLVVDLFGSVVYFFPWWYFRGTEKILKLLSAQVTDLIRTLNLPTLARFLFTPMYGLTDVWSRVISFPVRVVHFTLLTSFALLYMGFLGLLLMLWLIAPIFVLYNILYQLHLMPINIYQWIWL